MYDFSGNPKAKDAENCKPICGKNYSMLVF